MKFLVSRQSFLILLLGSGVLFASSEMRAAAGDEQKASSSFPAAAVGSCSGEDMDFAGFCKQKWGKFREDVLAADILTMRPSHIARIEDALRIAKPTQYGANVLAELEKVRPLKQAAVALALSKEPLAMPLEGPWEKFKNLPFRKGMHPRERVVDQTFPEYPFYDLGYGDMSGRTEQYGALLLPKAPVFHPYYPAGFHDLEYGAPAFTVNVKFPDYNASFVPKALHKHVAAMDPRNIDTFLSVQDMPWKDASMKDAVPMLLRPQGWLDPDAPMTHPQPYVRGFPVEAGLFSWDPHGPILQKDSPVPKQLPLNQQEGELIDEPGISVHNSRGSIQGTFDAILAGQAALKARQAEPGYVETPGDKALGPALEKQLAEQTILLKAQMAHPLTVDEQKVLRTQWWHPDTRDLFGDPTLISSGATLPVKAAGGADFDLRRSHVVFSLTKDKTSGRAAIVKHVLLNFPDQKAFENILTQYSPSSLAQLQVLITDPSLEALFTSPEIPRAFVF